MKLVLAFFTFPQFFLFFRRQRHFSEVGRHIFSDKVKVNLDLLRSVLTAFPGAFVDKNFLYKLIEHGRCQHIKVFIFVDQRDKSLGRFTVLLIAADRLFQLYNLTFQFVLLLSVLSVKGGIAGI